MWTIPLTRSGLSSSITTSRVWPELTQRRSAASTVSEASTVTTAGIGVITSRASCSCRWKTPPSIPASPGSSVPPILELSMICFRSSEVWRSSRSFGLTPKRRTIALENALSAIVTGAVATRNQFSGRETRRAVRSALAIASIFGTCSPMLMWRAVTRTKASASEIPTATPCERPPKTGSISFATAGSPRKPIPIEAIVIPIWQAESDSSILSSCSTTASAPRFPFLGELFDFPPAAAHQRELGRDEEAVDGDQHQQEDEQEDAHRLCGPVLRAGTSSAIRQPQYSSPVTGSSRKMRY